MRVNSPGFLLITAFLAILVTGCSCAPSQKQPEPGRPLIGGQISGLPDDTLATIYVRLPSGRVVLWGKRGNGPWEFVVTAAGGEDKVVTAEAEGYVSEPASYAIHLGDMTAYIIEDDQITTNEALHLDFHFEPVDSP